MSYLLKVALTQDFLLVLHSLPKNKACFLDKKILELPIKICTLLINCILDLYLHNYYKL